MQRYAPESVPYGIQRYVGETERLAGILDKHLKTTDYLVGNKYSIADINAFGWVNILRYTGIELDDFPSLKAWWERIRVRPAVLRGISIPSRSPFHNDLYVEKVKDDKEFAEKEAEKRAAIKAAKEKYNYKYSSP